MLRLLRFSCRVLFCRTNRAGTDDLFPPAACCLLHQSSDSILLAAIGGPKWDDNPRELRPETGLLNMRSGLGLYANLRPAKVTGRLYLQVLRTVSPGFSLLVFVCVTLAPHDLFVTCLQPFPSQIVYLRATLTGIFLFKSLIVMGFPSLDWLIGNCCGWYLL